MHYQQILQIPTTGKSLYNITSKVEAIVAQSGVEVGLCTLFLRHTSASLLIQENADPDVLKDLANFMAKLVPESAHYIHDAEYQMICQLTSVLSSPILQNKFLLLEDSYF